MAAAVIGGRRALDFKNFFIKTLSMSTDFA